jgi:hypothetical protein
MVSLSILFIQITFELFIGNATYAAITAVFAANGVLIAYIVTSVLEDRQEMALTAGGKLTESKKES